MLNQWPGFRSKKNLLYVLFLLTSLKLYFGFVNEGKKIKYLFSLIAFLFAVLSKGQAVSLPVIILGIEFIKSDDFNLSKALQNKIPYFIISVIFGIVAIKSQNFDGYINESHNYNFAQKLFIYSYDFLFYFVKIVFPLNLKAYYPYVESIGNFYSLISVFVLALFVLAYYLYKIKKTKIYLGIIDVIDSSCVV